MQKSLKDKVFVNRCILDSVLWFPIECPRAFGKFDDPVEFKRKWRDFFAQNKSIMENLSHKTESEKRLKKEFGHHRGYPEDIKYNTKVQKYFDEFRPKYSVDVVPYDADEPDPNEGRGWNTVIEPKDVLYGKRIEHL